MAKIDEVIQTTKDGRTVTLASPKVGDGPELLNVVTEIMRQSVHMLTTVEEFNLTPQHVQSRVNRPVFDVQIPPKSTGFERVNPA